MRVQKKDKLYETCVVDILDTIASCGTLYHFVRCLFWFIQGPKMANLDVLTNLSMINQSKARIQFLKLNKVNQIYN